MSATIMVYSTLPSEEKSKEIVRLLLEKHLIACATMFSCQSMYRWNEVIQDDREFVILVKTTEDKFELLQAELIKVHPYKIPCIIKTAVTANAPYAQWLNAELDAK